MKNTFNSVPEAQNALDNGADFAIVGTTGGFNLYIGPKIQGQYAGVLQEMEYKPQRSEILTAMKFFIPFTAGNADQFMAELNQRAMSRST